MTSNYSDSSFDRLIEAFRKFPGIGPRQARRFVYHLVRQPEQNVKNFAADIVSLKNNFRECEGCRRFFATDIHEHSLCPICANKNRDQKILMIVAHDSDFETIEKSGAYKGLYFILGGTLPILEKTPSYIREKALLDRISALDANLEEIIIAMNTTTEGDHTAAFLSRIIAAHTSKKPNLKITILGRGVSTGSELEYADSDTIKNALSGRKGV